MKYGSVKRPGVHTPSATWSVTRRYRSANIALWLHESASGLKRLLISFESESRHFCLPELQRFGSLGSYCGERLGRTIDQSVTGLVIDDAPVTGVVVLTRSA